MKKIIVVVIIIIILIIIGTLTLPSKVDSNSSSKVQTYLIKTHPQINKTNKPFTKTNLSTLQLNSLLVDTAIAGHGKDFKELEKEYEINAVYAIAVMRLESGLGYVPPAKNNLFCIRQGYNWRSFESPKAAILYFGFLMRDNMYENNDLHTIAKTYCEQSEEWYTQVIEIMNQMWERIENV